MITPPTLGSRTRTMPPHRSRRYLFTHVLLATATIGFAQTTPRDETIELEPFTVKGEPSSKFLASEVATGSRYATAIKDIPFPVTLLDKALMDDFLAFDFNDIASFASSFSPSEGTGRFFLRGIASRSTYKNGVRDTGLHGNAFVDRVEIIRGANAAIYGQTEPSGLRNVVTLRPRDRREAQFRATVGTDDYSRFSFGASEPLAGGKGAVRVDAFREDGRQRAIRFWNSRQMGAYSAGRWNVTPATRLEYSLESTRSRQPSTLTQAVIVDAATRTNLGVLGVQDVPGFPRDRYYGHTFLGSPSFNNVEVLVGDLTLSHRFNSAVTARVVVNSGTRRQGVLGVQGTPFLYNTTRTTAPVAGGTSFLQFYEVLTERQAVAQADVLGQFTLGATRHKLLLTADYLKVKNADMALAATIPAENVDAADYSRIGPILTIPPYLTDSFRNSISDRTLRGVLVSERAILLGDRLHLLLGGRRDTIREVVTPRRFVANNQVNQAQQVRPDARATTLQSGAVFKPVPAVSLFGNYSESFNPGSSADLDYHGRPIGNQEGRGFEAGLKASALGERLNFTAGWFRLEKSNLPFTATNAAGVALPPASGVGSYRVTGSQRSQGVELDLSFALSPGWLATVAYGRNDVQWVEISPLAPRNQNLIGRAPEGVPDSNFAGMLRHEVRGGPLKGLNVRAAVRYQGQTILSPTVTDAQGRPFPISSYTLWDFAAGYGWKAFGLKHRIDANVRNAFDEKYYRGGPFAGIPRQLYFSYELRY